MSKKKHSDAYLNSMCLCLFFAVVSTVLALCLHTYIAACCALAFWIAYVIIYIVAVVRKKDRSYFEQSLAATFASVLLVALSPIALIVWLLEVIIDKIGEKRVD